MTKTKSTSGNDDSTSLDLEWEDEEGILYWINLECLFPLLLIYTNQISISLLNGNECKALKNQY